MSNGLSKLVDAAIQVDELRKVLEKNQAEIAVKNVQVEAVSEFEFRKLNKELKPFNSTIG